LDRLYRQDVPLNPLPGYADFLRVWRNTADQYLDQYHQGRMTFEEQRVRRVMDLHANYGKTLSLESARQLNEKYVAYYEKEWRPYPDALPALEALKLKFRLGAISNGDGVRQRGKIKSCGLEPYFESVVISGEVGVAKPDKGIFEISRKAFGLAPEELAYVGDRVEIDVLGARNAGWKGIWIDRKGMPPGMPGGDPETVSSLSELLAKLS
jgi:putative hydrolase of the HAD superfamily